MHADKDLHIYVGKEITREFLDELFNEEMEPPRGFEPRTYALRVRCSTPELRRPALGGALRQPPKD